MNLSQNHYLYRGIINHRRFTPFKNYFTYPIYLAYIDLPNIEKLLKKSFFWNINKPALVSFYRDDYHGDPKLPVDQAVRKTVLEKTGNPSVGPIRLLTHLRYFGHCFNPVSFYYCFDQSDQTVETILAEITNIPWKERHSYIINTKIDSNQQTNLIADLEKQFHVSPFWGMDHQYEWLFSLPGKKLMVKMKNFQGGKKVFDATLNLKRETFSTLNLIKFMLRFPFITLMVVFRIHWQALKLWIKKAPFFAHPKKIIQNNNQ